MEDLHHLGRDGARENERNEVPGKKILSESMRDCGNGRAETPGLEREIYEKWDPSSAEYIHFDPKAAFEKVLKRIDGDTSGGR